jgi:phage terminase large subunit-like protein
MIPFWQRKDGKIKNASQWRRAGAEFNKAKAERACDFVETCCRHVKGELAGQLFKIEGWQREIVRGIFGWARPNGTRLYREVYIEVPRKNGKSSMGAALALYLLFADGEQGAEIYSAAADTDQAAIVFGVAKGMVEQDPDLSSVSESFRRTIVYKSNAYNVLSADAPTKHGKNSHGILFDELHAQPNRELYDVLKTSTGSRRSPLLIMFTTAGFDRNSVCWEVHDYALRVIEGTVDDPAFLPIIFAADEKDDWTSEKTWKKANPNFNVSIKGDYLAAECEKAKVTPAYENTFKRLHLNIWTEQETRWMPMDLWDACGKTPLAPLEEFRGKRCFGGLDLSSTEDLSALALVFPPDRMPLYGIDENKIKPNERDFSYLQEMSQAIRVLMMFWIPEDNIHERSIAHHVDYQTWRRQGLIEATPGSQIDYRYIIASLDHAKNIYDLKGVLCDPWGHRYISGELQDNHGFTVDGDEWKKGFMRKPYFGLFPQNYNTYTPALSALMTLVKGGLLSHGNNPILRWHASNFAVKEGAFGGYVPMEKKKNRNKYDGISALIFGVDLAIRYANQPGGSVYDGREMRFL